MLSLFRKSPRSITLANTGQRLTALPGETILQAALREGLRFPHSCRVGGCAACKCQLTQGRVKELTESAYVLSADELDSHYILACQSVPKTDIQISLPHFDSRSPNHRVQQYDAVVVAVRRLTHDISAVSLRLTQPVIFTAGQFANLRLPQFSTPQRAYSFAGTCPEGGTTELEFFIRHAPGGAVSPLFQRADVIGSPVEVDGPHGDFWLRPDDGAILAIAGGSGLAPLLSVLRQGLIERVSRPVTLLFGARSQRDLYCLDEINALAAQWAGPFEFIPVLSDEPADSGWDGLRGLVTQAIEGRISGDAQVYLCGPAPMIDAAVAECQKFSVRPTQIFFDKFSDSRDLAAQKIRA